MQCLVRRSLTAAFLAASLAVHAAPKEVLAMQATLRGSFTAAPGSPKEQLLNEAKALEGVKKFLEGVTIMKEIVVPDKLINFAVK